MTPGSKCGPREEMERHANDQEGQEEDKSLFPDQKSEWKKP
jgi:hypothetical protein